MVSNNFRFFFSSTKIQSKFQSFYMFKTFPSTSWKKKFSSNSHSDNETSQVMSNNIKQQTIPAFGKKKTKVCYTIPEENKHVIEKLKKGERIYPDDNQFKYSLNLIKEDFKLGIRRVVYHATKVKLGKLEIEYSPRETDILIIGGGALGLMIAYHLRSKLPHGPQVCVVDKDCDSPYLSANLGKGTLWQQLFTEREEVEMTQYFVEFMHSFPRITEIEGKPSFNVNYDPSGALYLADETNAASLMQKSENMKMLGIHHKLLDNKTLKNMFPWLNTDDVLFGSLGLCHEGLFDPWKFLASVKCKAINLGVTFLTAEVIDFGFNEYSPTRVIVRLPDGSYNSIGFNVCVIASGIETLNILQLLNNSDILPIKCKLPLIERKRYEYLVHNPNGPGLNTPIIINPDGMYFRREGLHNFYAAGVPSVDANGEDDVISKFDKEVHPFLMKRIPQLNNLDVITNWVDVYETNTVNNVGILGRHPDESRIIFANGFSNLGLQYVPAVGRAVMELIFYKDYQTINFNKFEIENLYLRQHLEAEKKRKELLEAEQKVSLTKS